MEMISLMSGTEVQKAMNRQNGQGWTPLLIASHQGHLEMVNNLLNNHARVDVFDNEGRSALHLAAERGFLEVSDFFLIFENLLLVLVKSCSYLEDFIGLTGVSFI